MSRIALEITLKPGGGFVIHWAKTISPWNLDEKKINCSLSLLLIVNSFLPDRNNQKLSDRLLTALFLKNLETCGPEHTFKSLICLFQKTTIF